MLESKIKIPILGYHHILDDKRQYKKSLENSPFAITTSQFRAQVKYLAENDFTVLSFADAINLITGKNFNRLQNRKFVVLTFDDGWQDNFDNALPVLQEFNFKATFFVISGRIDTDHYMSWDHLKIMQKAGMEIESHTHSHRPLETLSANDVLFELNKSRDLLEERLGKKVRYLSFPHGSYNRAIIAQLKQLPYQACANSKFGYARNGNDLYALPRILIRKNHTMQQFEGLCKGKLPTALKSKLLQDSKDLIRKTLGVTTYNRLYKIRYGIKRPASQN